VIGSRAGSAVGRVEQRPARASPLEALRNARRAFLIWRRTRPFWGGLLIIIGASEMLASEQSPLPVVDQIGIRGLAGYLTPTFMLLCGLLLWFCSVARTYHSLLAILLALDSWLTANLGGFLIGILISVVGGALAFGWMTDADYSSSERIRGEIKIRLRSWALEVVSQLRARRAWLSERRLRSDVAAALAVLRGLSAAGLRRRIPGRTQLPVQQALFELPFDLDADEPKTGGPLAAGRVRELLSHAETRAAAAARSARLALARRWRQSDR
jgi:Family of unknown function (DUF6114)